LEILTLFDKTDDHVFFVTEWKKVEQDLIKGSYIFYFFRTCFFLLDYGNILTLNFLKTEEKTWLD
jgi:hypothetical protein